MHTTHHGYIINTFLKIRFWQVIDYDTPWEKGLWRVLFIWKMSDRINLFADCTQKWHILGKIPSSNQNAWAAWNKGAKLFSSPDIKVVFIDTTNTFVEESLNLQIKFVTLWYKMTTMLKIPYLSLTLMLCWCSNIRVGYQRGIQAVYRGSTGGVFYCGAFIPTSRACKFMSALTAKAYSSAE